MKAFEVYLASRLKQILEEARLTRKFYRIAGVSGSCGQWMDGFSLIIAR